LSNSDDAGSGSASDLSPDQKAREETTYPAAVSLPGSPAISATLEGSEASKLPPESTELAVTPLWWIAALVADIILVVLHANNLLWSSMSTNVFLELVAIGNTVIAAGLYFYDLRKAVNDNLITGKRGQDMDIAIAWFVNLIMLCSGGYALYLFDSSKHTETFLTLQADDFYLLMIVISFIMFSGLDLFFSNRSISRRKTREYWELLFFVDAPATVAFVILSLLYVVGKHYQQNVIPFELFSGAIIMQMLIADVLFLLVQTNLHHVALTNSLVRNVTEK
jgi:hypothetical protein